MCPALGSAVCCQPLAMSFSQIPQMKLRFQQQISELEGYPHELKVRERFEALDKLDSICSSLSPDHTRTNAGDTGTAEDI